MVYRRTWWVHLMDSLVNESDETKMLGRDERKLEPIRTSLFVGPFGKTSNQNASYRGVGLIQSHLETELRHSGSLLWKGLVYIDFYWTGTTSGTSGTREYIGVYGRALVHEPRDRAVFWPHNVATLLLDGSGLISSVVAWRKTARLVTQTNSSSSGLSNSTGG